MKKKRPVRDRGAEAIRRAEKAIADAGWKLVVDYPPRYVAKKSITEREDDSTTTLYESDYTVETMGGGHFLHREYPDEFATRLLRHL